MQKSMIVWPWPSKESRIAFTGVVVTFLVHMLPFCPLPVLLPSCPLWASRMWRASLAGAHLRRRYDGQPQATPAPLYFPATIYSLCPMLSVTGIGQERCPFFRANLTLTIPSSPLTRLAFPSPHPQDPAQMFLLHEAFVTIWALPQQSNKWPSHFSPTPGDHICTSLQTLCLVLRPVLFLC